MLKKVGFGSISHYQPGVVAANTNTNMCCVLPNTGIPSVIDTISLSFTPTFPFPAAAFLDDYICLVALIVVEGDLSNPNVELRYDTFTATFINLGTRSIGKIFYQSVFAWGKGFGSVHHVIKPELPPFESEVTIMLTSIDYAKTVDGSGGTTPGSRTLNVAGRLLSKSLDGTWR